jgi:hypothetical protein
MRHHRKPRGPSPYPYAPTTSPVPARPLAAGSLAATYLGRGSEGIDSEAGGQGRAGERFGDALQPLHPQACFQVALNLGVPFRNWRVCPEGRPGTCSRAGAQASLGACLKCRDWIAQVRAVAVAGGPGGWRWVPPARPEPSLPSWAAVEPWRLPAPPNQASSLKCC